jgi:pyruvate dehydrogenase E1 component
VLTLVGIGAVLPETLAAADRLAAELGAGVGVVAVTSADLLAAALRAREAGRGAIPGGAAPAGTGADPADAGRTGADPAESDDDGSWILGELLPGSAPCPLLAVADGDPHRLGFLAGVRGDRLGTVGPAMSPDQAAAVGLGTTPTGAPVEIGAIVAAAYQLLAAGGVTR